MKPSRKTVALLTSSFPRWPGDPTVNYLYQLARRLSESVPADVDVVVPEDHSRSGFPPEPGLRVRTFPYFFPRRLQRLAYGSGMPDNLRRDPLAWLQVPSFLLFFFLAGRRAARKADVIYAHWMVPGGLVGAGLSRLFGARLILTVHSADLHLIRRLPGGTRLARLIADECDRITVVHRRQADWLLEMMPERTRENLRAKISVMPMGIEWESFQCRPDKRELRERYRVFSRRVVAFLGRLVPVKGVEVLIRALRGLPPTVLIVMGEGTERKRLERLARELRVDARFLGAVGDRTKIDCLKLSDVMALPSVVLPGGRTEGVPVSLLEGMASGLPVVASRVGGIPEVLCDGEEGFLISPGDSAVLKQKLGLLLADEKLREQMGEKARRTARNYDWGKVVKEFARHFCEKSETGG